MKFNFKKISAIATSALMVGMTAGAAAAANYPEPFVVDGAADVAIVYGTGAGIASTDSIQAGNIQTSLQSYMGTTGGDTVVTGGDSVQLERDPTNFFNLGEDMNDFYTSLDDDELSVVLAQGVYLNDLNYDFEYEQKITMGSNLVFEHFKNNDYNGDVPTLGFVQAKNDAVLNYSLEFKPDAAENTVVFGAGTSSAPDNLETTTIEMLGTEYYISKVDSTSYGVQMTLLDTANNAIVQEGESTTIGGHTVSISYIGTSEVKLVVDGEPTNSLTESGTYKLSDGTYVSIIDIMYNAKDTGISKVEVSLGTGKIILEEGREVQMNNEAISDIEEYKGNVLKSYFSNTYTKINSITLAWTLEKDTYLGSGDEWILPGFETIKVSMGDFITSEEETTRITPDGDDSIKLITDVKDGEVEINLAYLNSGSTAIEGIGEDTNRRLVTNATSGTTSTNPARVRLNESQDSYFVATWISGDDAESYVFEIGTITEGSSHTNSTTLENLAGGSDESFSEVGDDVDVGQMRFNLTASDYDTGMVTIDISATSGDVYTDRLVTAEGMQIMLPVNSSLTAPAGYLTNGTGWINLTASPVTFALNVTEEDKDGTIANGPSFLINFSVDSTEGIEPLSLVNMTTYETGDDTDVYEGYIVSPLATKVLHEKPTSGLNDLDIIYHGSEATVEVYVAESSATISGGDQISLGEVLVTDAEVGSVSDKNLIVVGGSCINSAAASLVGGAYCGAAFTEATGVGSGEFLIKSYDSTDLTSKKALLVAGYNAEDTVNAAVYLRTQTVDTDSAYKGTSSTTAEVIVA